MPEIKTAEEWEAAHIAEYSKYTAKEDIYIGNALAFAEGHPVPIGHVESGVVRKDQVATVKAAPAASNKEG